MIKASLAITSLEYNRLPAINKNAVQQMQTHSAGKHQPLEVPSFTHQIFQ
jgi:hypothetical protein